MADISIPKGDYGFYENFTVTNADGSVFDLTGYAVALKVWKGHGATYPFVSGNCAIVTATSGTCRYSVVSTDFAALGTFPGELQMSQAGVIQSTSAFTVEVTDSAP